MPTATLLKSPLPQKKTPQKDTNKASEGLGELKDQSKPPETFYEYWGLCCTTVYNCPLHSLPGGILHEGDREDVPLSLTGQDHPVPGHTLPHRAQQGDDQQGDGFWYCN